MNYTNLMWQALEGALGFEKAAWLRNAPLSEVTGITGLADAVGKHAVSRQEKRAFYRSVKQSAQALNELGVSIETSRAPEGFNRKIAAAQKVRVLEKHASAADLNTVQEVRRELDNDIFDTLIKQANILSSVAENPIARTLGKGLLGGSAAAVPLYAAGSALSEENAEQMRDKALQTAAGVGLIGLGTYGVGRGMSHLATERERNNQAARSVDMQRAMLANTLAANQAMKYSSAGPDGKTDLTKKEPVLEEGKGEEWLTKTDKKMPGGEVNMEMEAGKVAELMRVAYIDQFLAQVDQTEKVASLREMNRDYGVSLLCDLEKEAAFSSLPQSPRQAEMVRPPEGSVDPLYFFEKEAGMMSNLAKRTATGAGIGGVMGGTAGYMSGRDDNMFGRGGTRGRNALIGALGGAGAGAGVGRFGFGGKQVANAARKTGPAPRQLSLFDDETVKRVGVHNNATRRSQPQPQQSRAPKQTSQAKPNPEYRGDAAQWMEDIKNLRNQPSPAEAAEAAAMETMRNSPSYIRQQGQKEVMDRMQGNRQPQQQSLF